MIFLLLHFKDVQCLYKKINKLDMVDTSDNILKTVFKKSSWQWYISIHVLFKNTQQV